MQEILRFLEHHGQAVVFLVVILEQLGLPFPASPFLLAAGALAGGGKFSAVQVILLAALASLISDSVWFQLGRKRGTSILRLLCRISLEPDSCVSTTRDWFQRLGASSLLIAKFVPGLSTAAPPMAGTTAMPWWQFILADAAGSIVWSGVFVAAGVLFSRQLEQILDRMGTLGSGAGFLLLAVLGAYTGLKYWQRRRFMNRLRASRIHPDEVLRMMEAGDRPPILDLRHRKEVEDVGRIVRGAVWMDHKTLSEQAPDIPLERGVILYCS